MPARPGDGVYLPERGSHVQSLSETCPSAFVFSRAKSFWQEVRQKKATWEWRFGLGRRQRGCKQKPGARVTRDPRQGCLMTLSLRINGYGAGNHGILTLFGESLSSHMSCRQMSTTSVSKVKGLYCLHFLRRRSDTLLSFGQLMKKIYYFAFIIIIIIINKHSRKISK